MFNFNAVDIEFMGRIVTFDVVTFCGLICIAITTIGLATSRHIEQQRRQKIRIEQQAKKTHKK